MRTRGGRPLTLGGPFRLGFDLLWLPLLIGRLLFLRGFCRLLALRGVGTVRPPCGGSWLGCVGLPAINAERPLEQPWLLAVGHDSLSASKEPPSSPATTAS